MQEDDQTAMVTRLLDRISSGEPEAKDELFQAVYKTLRRIAQGRMRWERTGHTLQATDLVHEAYVRMAQDLEHQDWDSRGHFYHAASEAMRRILIEHARRVGAEKRGGKLTRVPPSLLDLAEAEENSGAILALDEAFQRLESMDPRLGQIVRLRFFVGLSVDETAAALEVSRRTVLREWEFARNWLFVEIGVNDE